MKKKTAVFLSCAASLFALEHDDLTQHAFKPESQEAASEATKKPPRKAPCATPSVEPGMPLTGVPLPTAILKSARIETGSPWDYQFTFAFNEYYATEEGVEIAIPEITSGDYFDPSGSVAAFDFGYHPGFQLGFIVNTPYDGWLIGAEYLWFRGHTHGSGSSSTPYYSSFFNGSLLANGFSSFTADWKLGIDLLDAYVARPFYAGMKWSVDHFFGLRGGWIRQYFHLSAISTTQQAVLKSNAWLLGPRGGLQANWLLGMGFSLFGNLSASLLYTKYPTISVRNSESSTKTHGTYNGASSLSPNADTGLGVKWASYFSDQSYYFDVSAAYNFSVFFSQNQVGVLNTTLSNGPGFAPGNLYLHGVSIKTSFLF